MTSDFFQIFTKSGATVELGLEPFHHLFFVLGVILKLRKRGDLGEIWSCQRDSFFGMITVSFPSSYTPHKKESPMNMEVIRNPTEQKVSLLIDLKNGPLGQRLSADEAESVVEHLRNTANEACREAFKQWLLQHECQDDTIIVNGQLYRFKMAAEKEFLTKFGHIILPRRLYQQDVGGEVYVPLDEAWNMNGQFAAIDVRDSLLYLSTLLSPGDTVGCLDKVASFSCSKTAIQNIINEMGDVLAEHEDELFDTVRAEEEIPVTKTRVMAVSLDGVNVRLNVPGVKKGRPTERPKDEASMSRETASCYKNAMVGVVSLYGDVPEKPGQNEKTPERLQGRCVARMPEEKFPTFREKIEAEIRSTRERLGEGIVSILLNDGGTNLWNYADACPLYEDFEKIMDFHHVLEHVSSGAEGIFGKGTQEAKAWYRKIEGTLLSYEDGAARVIRSLEYYLNGYEYSKSSRSLIESCLTFMRNNAHRMEYKRFRDNGWPIGSGPVEGSCKHIVKKRMCQSGQRWSLRGGQAILSLRAIAKSERWTLFWAAYKRLQKQPRLTQTT
jgi:hypothetical protein